MAVELLSPLAFVRKHSLEKADPDDVPDTMHGGWMESDEAFRRRILAKLAARDGSV